MDYIKYLYKWIKHHGLCFEYFEERRFGLEGLLGRGPINVITYRLMGPFTYYQVKQMHKIWRKEAFERVDFYKNN